MKIITLVVLVAFADKGYSIITEDDATDSYNSIQAALQQIALFPINWAAPIFTPANMSELVRVYCAKADGTTFEEVPLNDPNVLQKVNFVNKRTIFMFHGWRSNTSESWATAFKNNWVASKRSGNMCFGDWAPLAYVDYFTAAFLNFRLVAFYMTNVYLPWFVTQGMKYSDTIFMGHSLGAHIIGQIGAALPNQIPVAIGMDPAGPMFQGIPSVYRLSKGDAGYVQIIHSNQAEYGYIGKCGDADFYINLGFFQPECGAPIDPVAIKCSHEVALLITIDSIMYPNQYNCKGVRCLSSVSYLAKSCFPYVTDIFGLDSAKIPGEFYTATGNSSTCTGAVWLY